MARITYRQLVAAVGDLEKSVARNAEQIRAQADEIQEEAEDAARVANMIAAMNVDRHTVSETHALSRVMRGLSDSAVAYASAADTTARMAAAAGEQARTSHGGIQEAVSRADVDGIHDVSREWLAQE
ncbi:hypothetical protein [Streptomyces sp. NPDC058745]|uniref:hypothetical protein n=1 Tax=Streptomyces sp. NPDC058745 TaxID=3346621 RepID=UPI0036C8B79E